MGVVRRGRPESPLGTAFDVDAELKANEKREHAVLLRLARDEELLRIVAEYAEGFEARARGLLALLDSQPLDEAARQLVEDHRRLERLADADLLVRAPYLRLVMTPERWAAEEAKLRADREETYAQRRATKSRQANPDAPR